MIVGNHHYFFWKYMTGRGTYKRKRVLSKFTCFPMEERFPVKLDDFCSYFNISIFDLHLPCIFCGFYTDLQDLAAFHLRQLCIIWRSKKPFVCCRKCITASAKYEYDKYCLCTVSAVNLEGLLQKPLKDIAVRCLQCYKLCDLAEKFDCIVRQQEFCLVRGSWRALCRDCFSAE
uniref:Protein E6 n=1 Tax=Human papillomavirus TaxID=10566 RepID=A0A385PM14_9PAPI|nr:MAG: E6 protein [Human papillomavirus]